MGYRATRTADGALVIHRIPIFCACERGDVKFDERWIAAAVSKAKQSERENYYPPLHIRHHQPSTDANDSVRAAGYFRIIGTESITLKGARRTAIMADLVITDPAAQHEILSKRLPYRSVEIFNVDDPAIDGLALLDHEAPFLELPMLTVNEIDESDDLDDEGFNDFEGASFRASWQMQGPVKGGTAIACFRRGRTAHLLFREENPMANKTATKPKPQAFGAGIPDIGNTVDPVHFAEDKPDDGKDGKDGEDMEGVPLDVSSVVKAIESGDISVKDMDAILAAIQGQKTSAEPDSEPEMAPAAAPGAESMQKIHGSSSEKFAALEGKNAALEARINAMADATTRDIEVDAAMERLAGRPLGENFKQRLINYHTEHGRPAFAAFVDNYFDTIGVLPNSDGKGHAFASQVGKVPDVALKYQKEGTDAVDRAAGFHAIWKQLHDTGHTRMSAELYVANNMAREAARN